MWQRGMPIHVINNPRMKVKLYSKFWKNEDKNVQEVKLETFKLKGS